MYLIPQSFISVTIFDIVLYMNCPLSRDTILCIIFLFFNMFSSSIFFHSCYSYTLSRDESKKETKVKYCAECDIICYIFSVMYGENSVCFNALLECFN
jgi:hypothetical protein